ncbi:hypothetical protein D3C72_1395100 [compost metagenome]
MPGIFVAFGRAVRGLVDLNQSRVIGMAAHHWMVLKLAEAARKGHVLRARDVLVAEEQHAMLQEQRPDFCHLLVVLGCRAQVDVAEFCADRASQGLDPDRAAQRGCADHCGCRLQALIHGRCLL